MEPVTSRVRSKKGGGQAGRPVLPNPEQVTRYADMFAAMGTESRLRIMQLLLSAHPEGMVVGEIQEELGVSASNLSHHLDKLKNEELVTVTREGSDPFQPLPAKPAIDGKPSA